MAASHVLNEFDVVESRSPICTDAFDRGILASTVFEGLRPARETEGRSGSKPEGIRCVRGALIAFGLEAAVALFAYGIWEAWRLLR
jgi:hypothetical protein